MIFLSPFVLFTEVLALPPMAARLNIQLDNDNNLNVPVFIGTHSDSQQTAYLDTSSRYLRLLPDEVSHGGLSIGPFTLLGSNEQANLYVGSQDNINPSRTRTIGANFVSDFAREVGALMLVPSDTSESVAMIVGNFEPQEFCADPIVTVPALFAAPAQGIGMVYLSVSFVDRFGNEITNPTQPEHFQFDASFHVDWVPSGVMDNFQHIIEEDFGYELYADFTTEIHAPCAQIIDRLPSIRYSILDTSRENYILDVILPPRDYIRIDASGNCDVQLLEVNEQDAEYDSRLQATPNILGTNFLRQVAILFDYRNRQFGFCEPL